MPPEGESMERRRGFGPLTTCLASRHSTRLNYRRKEHRARFERAKNGFAIRCLRPLSYRCAKLINSHTYDIGSKSLGSDLNYSFSVTSISFLNPQRTALAVCFLYFFTASSLATRSYKSTTTSLTSSQLSSTTSATSSQTE